jgi:hypothetical protein
MNKFIGSRLAMLGLLMELVALVVLVLVVRDVYQALTNHHPADMIVPVIVGGGLGGALLSVGASFRRTGFRFLTGETSIIRAIGRLMGRRATQRSRERGEGARSRKVR